jgi:outer membrane lipoprotein carrier protein
MRSPLFSALLPALLTLAACQPDPGPAPASSTSAPASPPPAPASASAATAPTPAPTETAAAAEAAAAPTATASAAASAHAPAAATASAHATASASASASARAPAAASATASAAPSASAAAAPTAAPAPGSADAVALAIDPIFLGKNTFAARFKQENVLKASGVTKKSTGNFFFERPNKISFRYDAPSKTRVVSDGKELKIYDGENSQMFVQPVEKTEYPGALAFLMGKGLAPSFDFSFNDKAKFDGGPVLLGKPKTPSTYYETVLFYVDKALLEKKDPGTIRRVLLVDAQGNKNRFDFESCTQPEKIDPKEFVFEAPAGTNIIKN